MQQSVPAARMTLVRVPENLDSVRGLACLLVIALHVVGDNASPGLHLPMTSGWHYVMSSIEFLRMPLFTALSGYLYASRRVIRAEFAGFWSKKLRRLGIPLVCATMIVWFLRAHVYADQESLIDALLFSFGHLWYIQALIILFAVISVWDAYFRPGPVALMLAGLIAIMISQSGASITTCFSIAGALYLAPYFLFGIILRERPEWLHDRGVGTMCLGIVLIMLVSRQLGLLRLTNEVTVLQLPAKLAGMACVIVLLQFLPQIPLLAYIGSYSYTIYLWHIVASSAVRGALVKARIVSIPTLFVLCCLAALTAPIVLYYVVRRIPLLSVAFTGEFAAPKANFDRVAPALPSPL